MVRRYFNTGWWRSSAVMEAVTPSKKQCNMIERWLFCPFDADRPGHYYGPIAGLHPVWVLRNDAEPDERDLTTSAIF